MAADGTSSYCVDLTQAPWHDHCGDENTHIAIGLAGHLDKVAPPQAQLEGLVKVIVYLMKQLNLGIESVNGHREWSAMVRSISRPSNECVPWLDQWRVARAVLYFVAGGC